MNSESINYNIEIEKTSQGIVLRVVDIQVGANKRSFDDAYQFLNELYQRIEVLDVLIAKENRLADAKKEAMILWVQEGEHWTLDKSVKKMADRVGLCLLMFDNQGMIHSKIVKVTGVNKGNSSTLLRGQIAKFAEYFTKCEDRFILTDKGLTWVIDDVIPLSIQLFQEKT